MRICLLIMTAFAAQAAKSDPALARMILSKLNAGAIRAADKGMPDKSAQESWLASTKEQATGAQKWFVSRSNGEVSVGTVRQVAPTKLEIYRINATCNVTTGLGQIRLSWSPQPQTGQTMTAANPPVEYPIDDKESKGSGATAQSGHAGLNFLAPVNNPLENNACAPLNRPSGNLTRNLLNQSWSRPHVCSPAMFGLLSSSRSLFYL